MSDSRALNLARLAGVLAGLVFATGALIGVNGLTPARPPGITTNIILMLIAVMLIAARGRTSLSAGLRLPPGTHAFARTAGLVLLVLALVSTFAALQRPAQDADYMRSALQGIRDAEARLYADSGRYFTDPHRVTTVPWEVLPLRSIAMPVIALTADGWTAEMRGLRSGERCAIFGGSTALAPAVLAGTMVCTAPFTSSAFWSGIAIAAVGLALGWASGRLSPQRRPMPVLGSDDADIVQEVH